MALLVALMGLTSLALALWGSIWLVPPYLLAVALILFPLGRRETTARLEGSGPQPVLGPETAVDRVEAESDHRPPAEPEPVAEAPAETVGVQETATEPRPVAVKTRRGRGRGRGKAKAVVDPPGVTATWVRVGPGKFVRAELPTPPVDGQPPASEVEPASPLAPIASAVEGPPESEVADRIAEPDSSAADNGAPEPRGEAVPGEPIAEAPTRACEEDQPPGTLQGVGAAEDVASDEPINGDPSLGRGEVTPPRAWASDALAEVTEAAAPESPLDASCAIDGTPEGVGAAEDVASDEPTDGDLSPAREEVTPPRAWEPDALAEVTEAAAPESPLDASCVIDCGRDESSAHTEGEQALEDDGGAVIAAEELSAILRAEDPETGLDDVAGDHGIAPDAPVLVWDAGIGVVTPEGVGEGRLTSAASPDLLPRSTDRARSSSLRRVWWLDAAAALMGTSAAPSRRHARSGRRSRVTPDSRRRSPRDDGRSRRPCRTFPPRPPPRGSPARWRRGIMLPTRGLRGRAELGSACSPGYPINCPWHYLRC